MSQSDGADAERSELFTEARAESARPGGLAGPLAESTDEDGIGAASASAGRQPSPRPRSLWRDSNFLTFWSGQAFSQFGVADSRARDSCARGPPPERERVPGRGAGCRGRRRLPGGRAPRGRMDRPDAQAPRDDLGGRCPCRRARRIAPAVVDGRSADVAPLRRRADRRASRRSSSTCRTRASSRRSCARIRSRRRTASSSRRTSWPTSPGPGSEAGSSASSPRRSRS